MFLAAFAGVDIGEIRRGAQWALQQSTLVSELAAHSLSSFENSEWITAFWVYCNRLYSWGLWTQQLWAESLAKKINRSGGSAPRVSTPIPLIGANDQHSVLQQLAEGAKDKFVWFLRVKDSETYGPVLKQSLFSHQNYLVGKPLGVLLGAEAQATSQALENHGVHSISLLCEALSPATIGALFMTMELVVGTIGEVYDINAFDQPGVELGKRLALDILK
jgi:glucose-6-phosphate isomerase